ncbi:HAMP domain-containing sensor histidine kinase [Actinoallomurus sp. NPDC050550]|uniref:HAMP domain-containing sensor histidine kinase n=1 Tax=Actinoallomurus sp. NPDC050550 TaxID=3154937 RepID=UPI0033DADD8E
MIGLRARLVAAFAAVALLASAITAGIAYWLVRLAMLERVQNAVVNDVRTTLAQTVPTQLPDMTLTADLLQPISDALARQTDRQSWVLGNEPGGWATSGPRFPHLRIPPKLIATVRGAGHHDELARPLRGQQIYFQRISFHGIPYLVVGTPVYLPTTNSRVASPIEAYVIVSLTRERDDLDRMATSVAVGGGAAVFVALLLALLAARSVLRPVRRLAAAAQGLGAGDLHRRVEVRGRDELARLARIFNSSAEALEASVAELRDMERSARRFVADVSHELRTPLTAMTAVTDALEEEATGSAATAAGLVAEETRRLRTLIGHLLEISRFDAGAAALVLDDVDMSQLVQQSLRLRDWQEKVETDLVPELRARVDPRRFDMILANLVGNALRHGEPPVTVRLRRSYVPNGPGIRLRVSDSGPGIPKDVRKHVFERFYKADAARTRSEGSGLGLAIARANAELHGGELHLLDTDTGTTFELWLPDIPAETA